MYTKADSIDNLIAKSNFPEVMTKARELVLAHTTLPEHYFDNGRTFSAIAYGKLGDLGRSNNDYADAGLINLAPQKNYVGLYIWVEGGNGALIAKYAEQFPKSAYNKGCIYLKNLAFIEKYAEPLGQLIAEVKAPQ